MPNGDPGLPNPGELPLGIAAGVQFSTRGRLVQGDLACEVPPQPWHTMGLHRWQHRVEPAPGKGPHLVQRAGRQHGIEAGVDPAVQLGTVDDEKDLQRLSRVNDRRKAIAVPVGQRSSGRLQHFERAGDPHPVAGLEPLGHGRIAAGELGV